MDAPVEAMVFARNSHPLQYERDGGNHFMLLYEVEEKKEKNIYTNMFWNALVLIHWIFGSRHQCRRAE